ncbi:BolA-like protein [mine drainage metagenome]|uniref:BolA-like protein n=1 Tax=mine drainage metagenome TaxID=410659 RepID=T0YA57_9ZZZZ
MKPEDMQKLVAEAIPGSRVEVESVDGRHFTTRVIAAAFEGLPPVQRHRRIYAALGGQVGTAIHALSVQAFTPEEWERRAP